MILTFDHMTVIPISVYPPLVVNHECFMNIRLGSQEISYPQDFEGLQMNLTFKL